MLSFRMTKARLQFTETITFNFRQCRVLNEVRNKLYGRENLQIVMVIIISMVYLIILNLCFTEKLIHTQNKRSVISYGPP